jgi:hypothetical protein
MSIVTLLTARAATGVDCGHRHTSRALPGRGGGLAASLLEGALTNNRSAVSKRSFGRAHRTLGQVVVGNLQVLVTTHLLQHGCSDYLL